ncbi:NBR1-Ig-like domain-containing protein [Anaerolineales bacterium HSG24]|nr:NBR1-Ig-like domain-containing protein [Anaerolineales bacterium HSG24]
MNQFLNFRGGLLLTALTFMLLITACNAGNSQPDTPQSLPQESAILSPIEDGRQILLGSAVQVQSSHATAQNVTNVELWIQGEHDINEQLIRADTPNNGMTLQEWYPQQIGAYTIKVRAWNNEGQILADLIRQVEIVESRAMAIMPDVEPANNPQAEIASFGAAQEATPEPNPAEDSGEAEDVPIGDVVEITVSKETVAQPTSVPYYPPPPPAPGVPPGPTQEQLNNFGPPVCNAAEYIGVYTTDTSRRVFIAEPDEVPGKTVGGTTIHRAWRVQNVGTCTWGPGYELAFYGGRAMGSGGVAFDSVFPTEPPRRNTVISREQLVVPDGKPNQTAVLEILMEAPTTPGIHQSYWRMRDPHGVFFGPIMGVTLETVRDCEFGVYGAPVINYFRVSGTGNLYNYVYNPTSPVEVDVQVGDVVTLDWQIINATNFDIVFESPTGRIDTASTTNSTDRASYTIEELGDYGITLYADNGSCTVPAQIKARGVPRYEDQFVLNVSVSGAISGPSTQSNNLTISSSLPQDVTRIEWRHFDPNVSDMLLYADLYVESRYTYCPVVDSVMGWKGHCYETTEWRFAETIEKPVGGEGEANGAASISNIDQNICQRYGPNVRYQLRYQMRASENGRPANPELSNRVDVEGYCSLDSTSRPTELE